MRSGVARSLLAFGVLAAWTSACATSRFRPPIGTLEVVADAAAIWAEASSACRAVEAYGGELRVSGRLSGQRIAGVTLGLAVEREGRVAIDARYGTASIFTLRGTTEAATFVDTESRGATTAPAGEILEALVGVRLEPARLLAVLSGCVSAGAGVPDIVRIGPVLRATSADAVIYLVRVGNRWVIRAGAFDRWEVDYPRRDESGPRQIVLRSERASDASVELTLTVGSSDTARRDPSVFTPIVPAGAESVPIDSLRENGPFGRRPRVLSEIP